MASVRRIVLSVTTLAVLAAWAALAAAPSPPQGARQAKDGIYRVGHDGVTPPRSTKKVDPQYTDEAEEAKLQGTVAVYVEIWPDGRAHNSRIVRGLGMGLDENAMEALEQWEFEPGKKNGKPVKVGATIEINFRLN